MKMKYYALAAVSFGTMTFMTMASPAPKHGLVVHEWGTFTSLQGGDGKLLAWKPLVTSSLPGFVYDWNKPGFNRFSTAMFVNKGEVVSWQRMETPVVYFYSDRALTADLSVEFPEGRITEWYPQARRVGPSFVPPSKELQILDSFVHRCGVSSSFSFVPLLEEKPVTNSVISWPDIHVLSPEESSREARLLPLDEAGAHYFAARQTDANLLQLDSSSPAEASTQLEKFLFYRGIGNFTTPLLVQMKSENEITVANSGVDPLAHLFLLDVRDNSGAFIALSSLAPGEKKTIPRPSARQFVAQAVLTERLAREMSRALVQEGLYPREADAMVNTWKDSWFAEDGVRVLYTLPRAWTDQTLPMNLKPTPRELVRVMLGRAEVLTPGLEKQFTDELDKARSGDAAALAEFRKNATRLGRFAEPAYLRAAARLDPDRTQSVNLARIFYNPAASQQK